MLVAGTRQAIEVFEAVLGDSFDVTSSTALDDALARAGEADLVICNVRFDDSRMFEFLHALRERPGPKLPVICCRVQDEPLSPNFRRAIEHALEALGIAIFVDRSQLIERYGVGVVDEMLRQLVLDRLPPQDDPLGEKP